MDNSIAQSGLNTYSGKKLHIEYLRVLAVFFVIFSHTGADGYSLFTAYSASNVWHWLLMSLSSFSKVCVPTFFAISGALLLKKEESIKVVYSKRVLKMCVVLALISAFYYLLNNGFHFSGLSIRSYLGIMYISEHSPHLWYLYAFIPFLMSLPLLRQMVKNFKNIHFLYMAICVLLFTAILPIIEIFIGQGKYNLNSNFRMKWLVQVAVIYPFMGYYIENRMDTDRARKYVPWLWAVSTITLLIFCFEINYKVKTLGFSYAESLLALDCSFSLVHVFTVYVTAKCYFEQVKVKSIVAKTICSLGNCTFGIYLIHGAAIYILNYFNVLHIMRDTLGINAIISCLLFCVAVLLVSYVSTLIAKKIPGIRKLI